MKSTRYKASLRKCQQEEEEEEELKVPIDLPASPQVKKAVASANPIMPGVTYWAIQGSNLAVAEADGKEAMKARRCRNKYYKSIAN